VAEAAKVWDAQAHRQVTQLVLLPSTAFSSCVPTGGHVSPASTPQPGRSSSASLARCCGALSRTAATLLNFLWALLRCATNVETPSLLRSSQGASRQGRSARTRRPSHNFSCTRPGRAHPGETSAHARLRPTGDGRPVLRHGREPGGLRPRDAHLGEPRLQADRRPASPAGAPGALSCGLVRASACGGARRWCGSRLLHAHRLLGARPRI